MSEPLTPEAEPRFRIGSHFMRHRWFVFDRETDDPVSEHRTREAAIAACDRLNAALAAQPAPADPRGERRMPIYPMAQCLDGRHPPFNIKENPNGCPRHLADAARAPQPAPADPEPNWRADRTGHCLCGGQCHHGDRIEPCSESCAEAMQRSPAPAGVRDPEEPGFPRHPSECSADISYDHPIGTEGCAYVLDGRPTPDLSAALREAAQAVIAAWDAKHIEVVALDGLDPMDNLRAALAHPAPKEPREDAG